MDSSVLFSTHGLPNFVDELFGLLLHEEENLGEEAQIPVPSAHVVHHHVPTLGPIPKNPFFRSLVRGNNHQSEETPTS